MAGSLPSDVRASGAPLPIAAIGASAGGLEALRQFFKGVPEDSGLAFVVIQHLDPDHPSLLASVLATDVTMPVAEAADGTLAQANHVYVIPPGVDLGMREGLLTLRPRPAGHRPHLSIDAFFTALAADHPGPVLGAVLSGSASDGTEGLRAIKAAGGLTFAQEHRTAQFRSMPESAIAAGVVDYVAPPTELAGELVRLARHPYLATPVHDEAEDASELRGNEESLNAIFGALRQHAKLDFREYRRPTLLRRIARRMALRRFETMADYAAELRRDPVEAKALAEDVLIQVTSFFRDPEAFEAVKAKALPALLEGREADDFLRVWVPGCSSGEELYSLAICVKEVLGERHQELNLKFFGTDLSERAIDTARAGIYSETDLAGVSPERLNRFFERVDGQYRIDKHVRDCCVFVQHDLTHDPPFARLDLISCRNVLIYFDPELQRRVLAMFHHCLARPGYLLLGKTETVRDFAELFPPADREQRLYLKIGETPRVELARPLDRAAEPVRAEALPARRPRSSTDARRHADHVLLARYAPPGVVTDSKLEVLQFRGRTSDFLRQPPGEPQTNLLKLAREELVHPLREALERARQGPTAVRQPGLRVTDGPRVRTFTLEVLPLESASGQLEPHFLVIFDEGAPRERPDDPRDPPAGPARDEELARLRLELAAARDALQSIGAEHEDSAETVNAVNEELVAANEELQSTNEELQSTKEELQSTNEELTTLNDELNHRNHQLDVFANDLVNILESVQIPVIIVDDALRIRRFTPSAREISSLLPGDVGRSIDDVKLRLKVDDLIGRIRDVTSTLTPKETEVQGSDGHWYRLHIRPYRTSDGRVGGAILAFLDIDVLKRALEEAERVRDYVQRIVETVPMSLMVLDSQARIVTANSTFLRSFGPKDGREAPGERLTDYAQPLDVPALQAAITRSMSDRAAFRDVQVRCVFPGRGRRELVVAGCPIQSAEGQVNVLVALEDVTSRRQLEASERQSRQESEEANRAKDLFLATLSHELRTPLNTILLSAQVLRRTVTDDAKVQRATLSIERSVANQARLIDDLLDISRIVSGKLTLELQPVDLATIVQTAVDIAQPTAETKGLRLTSTIRGEIPTIHGDPVRLQQVVSNLITNSIKFTPRGGEVEVSLESTEGKARIRVRDTGMGLRADLLPRIFDRFVQGEGTMTRAHGGLGLGLSIVRHLVEVHGGAISAESPGEGRGATFTVTLPLPKEGEVQRPQESGTVAQTISGVRVMVIDDEEDTREACVAVLRQQGALVEQATSAREGLSAVASFGPQVILCDIAMPGEDGFAFIHALRSGAAGRATPAAALTALAGEDVRRHALEAGFQLHLAKPIDADRLTAAVSRLDAGRAALGAGRGALSRREARGLVRSPHPIAPRGFRRDCPSAPDGTSRASTFVERCHAWRPSFGRTTTRSSSGGPVRRSASPRRAGSPARSSRTSSRPTFTRSPRPASSWGASAGSAARRWRATCRRGSARASRSRRSSRSSRCWDAPSRRRGTATAGSPHRRAARSRTSSRSST